MQIVERDRTQLTPDFADRFVPHLNRLRRESLPDDPPLSVAEVGVQMANLPSMVDLWHWTVEDQGGIHAHASIETVEDDSNQHLAELDIMIEPEWRRRGIGSQLLRRAALHVRALGRRVLMTGTIERVPAGAAFLERYGFERGMVTHLNQLRLTDLPPELIESWTTLPGDAYRLDVWEGDVPEADIAAYAGLLSVMNSAPRDDLDIGDTTVTPEHLREREASRRAGGRVALTAVVRHAGGDLVGLSQLSWAASSPEIIAQGNTGVLPEHRGHGLGRLLKAGNLRRLLQVNPAASLIRTQNAGSNAPMVRLNTEMGFELYMAGTVWQGDLDTVLARLKE